MGEYIKASDLYEFRNELMDMFLSLCNYNDFNKLTLLTISETIDKIYGKYESRPLADVEEVKHGKWMRYGSDWECSECDVPLSGIFPYCPYCGAKMDGGKEE